LKICDARRKVVVLFGDDGEYYVATFKNYNLHMKINQLHIRDDLILQSQADRKYIYFSSACAFISAFTTVIIHFISSPSGSFEETVLLYKNNSYLLLKWTILFHCLMVLLSMLGMSLIIFQQSKALAVLGFLFFSLFVFAEWERTLNDLWYINGLRRKYSTATDESTLNWLRNELQYNNFQSNVKFLLFIIGFTLGNATNGLVLMMNKNRDRYLGIALLIWAFFTSCAFISDFVQARWMDSAISFSNHYYQPFIRVVIAVWLFDKAIKYSKKSVLDN
jgi:hypothetical protein